MPLIEKIIQKGGNVQKRETKNSGTTHEVQKLKINIEKQKEKLKTHKGHFKIEIPDERQSAIEYDLEVICTLQGCTIGEVLELNNIDIGRLKPGRIITIPILEWSGDDEKKHEPEQSEKEKVEWNNVVHSGESQKIAEWILKNHHSDTSIIFEKKDARMYIFKDGKMLYTTVFLSGKNNTTDVMNFPSIVGDFSDETNPEYMITPAGKFPINLNEETEEYPLSFDYLRGEFASCAVHTPTKKIDKISQNRLNTPQANDNNTTWGCMVMTPEALKEIRKYYQEGKTYSYVLPLHGNVEEYIPLH